MGPQTITLPMIEYYDLVRRAASWNAVVSTARDTDKVSSKLILQIEIENVEEYQKEARK